MFRVGCSGWDYKHWRGDFYAQDLPRTTWLERYASNFDTVELNNSFYRLPEAERFARWAAAVPPGFVFAVKASRYLTHLKRLGEPEEPLGRLLDRVRHLDAALGPLLYQLPPRWVPDAERLEHFLGLLPASITTPSGRRHRLVHAIEFRDPRGYEPVMLRLLERHGVALCLHDMAGSASPREVTARCVYVRFHGEGSRYGGRYSDATLGSWADWLAAVLAGGVDVFAYFNNDTGGHAPRDAVRLRELLTGRTPTGAPVTAPSSRRRRASSDRSRA